jgi:large subunit ribosomal protein L32
VRVKHKLGPTDTGRAWAGRLAVRKQSLYSTAAMAVPKRKTSKSRRDKRRANHKAALPALVECPQCHQPKRPHHVCPTCGTYKGREVEPLKTTAP